MNKPARSLRFHVLYQVVFSFVVMCGAIGLGLGAVIGLGRRWDENDDWDS